MVMSSEKKAIAHLRQDDTGTWIEHDLFDHLKNVASIAASMAHDLGEFNNDQLKSNIGGNIW